MGKKPLNRPGGILALGGIAMLLLLGLFIALRNFSFVAPDTGPPELAKPYPCVNDNFSIRPPLNWGVEDEYKGAAVVFYGPMEPGYRPLISVLLEIAPGKLETYVKEHKGRMEHEGKDLKWLAEDEEWIDGCRTVKLEYEADVERDDHTFAKVHALQFILDSKPRFYRISCFVSAKAYPRYREKFEASARSFIRLPLSTPHPKIVSTP